MNAVSIVTHKDLSSILDEYATDLDFKDVTSAFALGKKDESYDIEDCYPPYMEIGYVLPKDYVRRLCMRLIHHLMQGIEEF